MKKIADFLKNYKTILIVSVIALILATVSSAVITRNSITSEVTKTNGEQLPKISGKYMQLKEQYSSSIQLVQNKTERDAEVFSSILSLGGDQAYAEEYLAVCRKYADGTGLWETIAELTDSGITTEEILWKLSGLLVGLDTNSLFCVTDPADGSLIYSELNIPAGTGIALTENTDGTCSTADGQYMVQYYDVPEARARLLALTPEKEISERCTVNVLVVVLIYLVVFVVLVAYMICLRQGELDPKQEYRFLGKNFLHSQTKRFRALAVVLGIVVAVAYTVLTSLNDIKYDLIFLDKESKKCVECFEAFDDLTALLNETQSNTYYGYARLAGEFLNRHPEYLSKSGMEQLADALQVRYVSVFDSEGNTVCTSSPLDNLNVLGAGEESSIYALRYALIGVEGVTVSGDKAICAENARIHAVPRRNPEGIADGGVAVTVGAENWLEGTDAIAAVIEKERNRNGSYVFLVDGLGVADEDTTELATQIDIDSDMLQDGYSGILEIGESRYLTKVAYADSADRYIFVVTPYEGIKLETFLKCLFVLIFYAFVCAVMMYDGLGSRYSFEWRESKIKDADDWERTELYWDELSVGQKMGRIISVCVYVLSICCVILLILAHNDYFEKGIITTITSGSWKNSINGYSVVANICICMLFYSGIRLAEYLLKKMECIVGDDSTTGIRLVASVTKYIGVLACAFIVVTNFGVDAATALASLGIASFALSFGAQELVKDMIAGLFLLFEGNFRVGDLLDINGSWYWIRSIGVRTTMVEAYGSVKVINNSQMTGIVNIQNYSSAINCDVMISNKYDVDTIAGYMRAELPALKEKFDVDVSTPVWKGIREIKAEGTVIRTTCYCPPLKSDKVGPALKAGVKAILDRHGIELAYEAILVHSDAREPKEIMEEIRTEQLRKVSEENRG